MSQLRLRDTSLEIPISSHPSSSGPTRFQAIDDVWQSHSCLVSVQSASPPPSAVILNTKDEVFQWTRYLSEMESRGKLSPIVTSAARELWNFLLKREPGIEVPHAGPTGDGGLLMAWDRDRHYFELEVSPSGRYDWFYRDHEEDTYWGAEDCTVGSYSEDLLSTIRRVWPESESKRQIEFAMVGGEQR